MKRLMIVMISIIFVALIINCDNNPVEPQDQANVGMLRLVPLQTEDLAKATTDANGQQWLPATEVNRVLHKVATAAINFGEVKATRTLQYVIMNIGNQDVFDIHFSAGDLYIYPGAIGLIEASEQGTEVSALPIVNIVKKHVIPIDGVGSLLDMEVGTFTDTLSLTYYYTQGNDTVTVSDDYDVAGTKMGAVIDLIISGIKIENYVNNIFYQQPIDYDFNFSIYDANLDSTDLDSVIITNSGNVNIPLVIKSGHHSNIVLDTTITFQSQINLTGIIGYANQNSFIGEKLLLGGDINQPYIFSFAGKIYTNGIAGIIITMKSE